MDSKGGCAGLLLIFTLLAFIFALVNNDNKTNDSVKITENKTEKIDYGYKLEVDSSLLPRIDKIINKAIIKATCKLEQKRAWNRLEQFKDNLTYYRNQTYFYYKKNLPEKQIKDSIAKIMLLSINKNIAFTKKNEILLASRLLELKEKYNIPNSTIKKIKKTGYYTINGLNELDSWYYKQCAANSTNHYSSNNSYSNSNNSYDDLQSENEDLQSQLDEANSKIDELESNSNQ